MLVYPSPAGSVHDAIPCELKTSIASTRAEQSMMFIHTASHRLPLRSQYMAVSFESSPAYVFHPGSHLDRWYARQCRTSTSCCAQHVIQRGKGTFLWSFQKVELQRKPSYTPRVVRPCHAHHMYIHMYTQHRYTAYQQNHRTPTRWHVLTHRIPINRPLVPV